MKVLEELRMKMKARNLKLDEQRKEINSIGFKVKGLNKELKSKEDEYAETLDIKTLGEIDDIQREIRLLTRNKEDRERLLLVAEAKKYEVDKKKFESDLQKAVSDSGWTETIDKIISIQQEYLELLKDAAVAGAKIRECYTAISIEKNNIDETLFNEMHGMYADAFVVCRDIKPIKEYIQEDLIRNFKQSAASGTNIWY